MTVVAVPSSTDETKRRVAPLIALCAAFVTLAALLVSTSLLTASPAAAQAGGFACESDQGQLSWTDDGVAKYWVYRSTDSGQTYNWIGRTAGSPAATSFVDQTPTVGARYQVHYQGIARVECSIEREPVSPGAGFACESDGGQLSWTDDGVAKYWVYKSTDSGQTYNWIGRTKGSPAATNFTDPNPTASARYQVHYQGIPRAECSIADEGGIVSATSLNTLPDCAALLDHLQGEGLERVGPYGLSGTPGFFIDGPFLRDDFLDFDAAPAPAPEAGVDFSETNVQELGIDEPDIIKTDGQRILVVDNNEFIVVDVSGDEAQIIGRTALGDNVWGQEMLVEDDRVVIFGQANNYVAYPGPLPIEPLPIEPAPEPIIDDEPLVFGRSIRSTPPSAVVIEIDLTNAAEPSVAAELTVEGRYLSARLVDGVARVAVQSDANDLPFVYPSGPNGEELAEEVNRATILRSTLADWLPTFTLERSGAEVGSGLLSPCDRVHAPTKFSGFGSLSVLSFDLSEPLGDGQASSVLAAGDTVYSSSDSFYVATNNWFNPFWNDVDLARESDSYTTSIHGFDISEAVATYRASGGVPGHLLNQFSMSEHEGYLRVATTSGAPWRQETESFVYLLDSTGADLRTVGSVGEMGRGERIRSVRFAGDVGYVVTFRQTDPFYTVDLSKPTAPVVRGELKITGYSGQLFPIDDSLVIGIGREATDGGRITGAKMTLFDVADLDDPVDIANWVLPDAYTDAEWDHRAFLWWQPEDLAVFPVSSYTDNFYGAIAFRVTRDSGITEVGRIEHETGEPYTRAIRRSLVIGDDLWTLSSSMLQSNGIDNLDPTQQVNLR